MVRPARCELASHGCQGPGHTFSPREMCPLLGRVGWCRWEPLSCKVKVIQGGRESNTWPGKDPSPGASGKA